MNTSVGVSNSETVSWKDSVNWIWRFWKYEKGGEVSAESEWELLPEKTADSVYADYRISVPFECSERNTDRVGVVAQDSNRDSLTLPEKYRVGKGDKSAFGVAFQLKCE